jgi:hypothetical protein
MRLGVVVLMALGLLVLAGSAGAGPSQQERSAARMECDNVGKGLQRCEGEFFIVYIPLHWLSIESTNGVDVSSPTGVYYAGFGFSSWYQPLSFDDILAYGIKYHGFDAHPLRNFQITSRSRPTGNANQMRQVSTWTAVRTDRHERAQGVIAIDLFRNDASGAYGYDNYVLAAPAADFRRVSPTLVFVLKHVFYHPH